MIKLNNYQVVVLILMAILIFLIIRRWVRIYRSVKASLIKKGAIKEKFAVVKTEGETVLKRNIHADKDKKCDEEGKAKKSEYSYGWDPLRNKCMSSFECKIETKRPRSAWDAYNHKCV
jgi:hypothetical protein